MKKRSKMARVIVLVLAIATVLSFSSTAFAATTTQIRNLQANMNYFYVGDSTNAMLAVDGILGVKTKEAYGKIDVYNVDTAYTYFVADVKTVQRALNADSEVRTLMGGNITVDGLAGSSSTTSTRRATAHFQSLHYLASDGICGKDTRYEMFGTHSKLWTITQNNRMAG